MKLFSAGRSEHRWAGGFLYKYSMMRGAVAVAAFVLKGSYFLSNEIYVFGAVGSGKHQACPVLRTEGPLLFFLYED